MIHARDDDETVTKESHPMSNASSHDPAVLLQEWLAWWYDHPMGPYELPNNLHIRTAHVVDRLEKVPDQRHGD